MSVELKIKPERATLIWCQAARASAGWKEAVNDNDKPNMIRYGTWMETLLEQIHNVAPADIAPDGNETKKP